MLKKLLMCCVLLLLTSACVTPKPGPKAPSAGNPRRSNLQRAAPLPWKDQGRCVVHEASQPWPTVVERCFHALDTRRMRFHDTERQCPIASVGAAAVPAAVGICLLSQPYLVVGAVVVIGVVVAAAAIQAELEANERSQRALRNGDVPEEALRPGTGIRSTREKEIATSPQPAPGSEGANRDPLPPLPPRPRRPECKPIPTPHLGGDALHNQCADLVPLNSFRGHDVLVNGKHFDALQARDRVLWEIKTDQFDTYSSFLRRQVIANQLMELHRERELARACGYEFWVGVRSAAHRAALRNADPSLDIVTMDWC
jgi:hypothetical protein